MIRLLERPTFLQIILALGAVLVFGQVYSFGYNLDDEIVLQVSRFSHDWEGFVKLMNSPYYTEASGFSYGYRPVTSFTFYLESIFFGQSPQVSHIINWLLYLIIVLMVFRLALFLLKEPIWAFCAALVFLLHPFHAEVVASIKNRDELLALLFGLLAFFAIKKDSWKNAVFALVFVLLSLLSKKSGIGLLVFMPVAGLLMFKWSATRYFTLAVGLSLSVFYFIPSESVSTRLIVSILLFGCYLLTKRFAENHGMKPTIEFFTEAILTLGLVLMLYCFFSFSLGLILLSAGLLVVAYWLKPTIVGGFALVLCAGGMSVFTHNWTVLILVFLLFQTKQAAKKGTINDLLLGFIGVFCLYHIFTHSDWISLLFVIAYTLPFVSGKFENVWLMRVSFLSISVAFILNVWSFSKWAYIVLLLSLLIFYLLKFKGYFSPKPVIASLIVLLTVLWIDPSVFLGDQVLVDNVVERSIAIQNDGRELFFMENPLSVQDANAGRVLAALNTYGFYLGTFFVPLNQSAYYGYDTIHLFSLGKAVIWMILIGAFLVLQVRYRLRTALVLFCLFLVCLLPFSNLAVPVAGIVGDRLMFTPSLMLSLTVVFLLRQILESKKYWVLGGLALWLLPLSLLSYNRTSQWKDKQTLFLNDIENQPESVKLNELLADWYYFESEDSRELRMVEALKYYQKGAKIYPEYDRNWYMMGKVSQEQGQFTQALDYYQRVDDLDFIGNDFYLNAGICAMEAGDFATADDYLKKAVSIPESSLSAYQNLMLLYLKANNPRLALSTGEVALQGFPDDGWLNEAVGKIHYQLGNLESALKHLSLAIELGRDSQANQEMVESLQ